MTNPSIYSAFERMWQHVIARLGNFITSDSLADWVKASAKPTYTAEEVGADPTGSAVEALVEAKAYADTAVAALVNAAPETLDTLGELAIAFEENADMVETLNQAVTNKADKTELENLSELVDINATAIESLQEQVLPTSLILTDAITGTSYTIQIQNGQLVSFETPASESGGSTSGPAGEGT